MLNTQSSQKLTTHKLNTILTQLATNLKNRFICSLYSFFLSFFFSNYISLFSLSLRQFFFKLIFYFFFSNTTSQKNLPPTHHKRRVNDTSKTRDKNVQPPPNLSRERDKQNELTNKHKVENINQTINEPRVPMMKVLKGKRFWIL